MSITIDLTPALEEALRADAAAHGRPAEALAAERLAAWYVADRSSIAEGSPEEDAAIDAALAGNFHPFDSEEERRKMQARFPSARREKGA